MTTPLTRARLANLIFHTIGVPEALVAAINERRWGR